MRRVVGPWTIAGIAVIASAHVGSPDAWFEGMAGAYPVTVHIEAPPVVPGIAVINVKADDAHRVRAFVNTFDAEGGTPPPDELVPAADRPGWRRARLWVMNAGSNRVTVSVSGARGEGSVVVPLAATAQRRLAFTPRFVLFVAAGAAVLLAGILTFIGAAVRESVLEPGIMPDENRRRRARWSMARGAVFVAVVLTGMTAWWRAEDRAFRARLFRPLDSSTHVEDSSGTPLFVLAIDDTTWVRRSQVEVIRARGELPATGLVDDHGKVMHLFLASDDGRSMAHLHPTTTDSIVFTSRLPALPAGSYRVFADIVQESGFTQTLTSTVHVPAMAGAGALGDADDSWAVATPDARSVELADGTRLSWVRNDDAPIRAREEAGLQFVVDRQPGDTASLQSYLGMRGHAAVVRDDGGVFIHLHPMGTISPAAQARLSGVSMHNEHSAGIASSDTLRFPYAFPEAGTYTVWVQLKRRNTILTGSFLAQVMP